jgi:hypothetical protein
MATTGTVGAGRLVASLQAVPPSLIRFPNKEFGTIGLTEQREGHYGLFFYLHGSCHEVLIVLARG